MKLRKSTGPGPKMNREQRRAFDRYLRSPEGKAAVARVRAENEAKKQVQSDTSGNDAQALPPAAANA